MGTSRDVLEETIYELKQELKDTRKHRDRLINKVIKLSKKKKPVLELKESALERIREIAKIKHCIDDDVPCNRCPLYIFDNEDKSCSEIAKNLLDLFNV